MRPSSRTSSSPPMMSLRSRSITSRSRSSSISCCTTKDPRRHRHDRETVLILGRFTPERKAVLDALREEFRRRDYLPILFDFDKPASKDLTGTVLTLAHMARFIIADLTDPSCSPYEVAKKSPTPSFPFSRSFSPETASSQCLRTCNGETLVPAHLPLSEPRATDCRD